VVEEEVGDAVAVGEAIGRGGREGTNLKRKRATRRTEEEGRGRKESS